MKEEIKFTQFDKDGKVISSPIEGTYGMRCRTCMKLIEDWSVTGDYCKEHRRGEEAVFNF